ncbi:MAG: peptide/nickel transport system substrate-binding protein [Chloroflexota bacterium]|nr:peptide/nickel transport system substrate-binding protein [Chloroflexota bacterium]
MKNNKSIAILSFAIILLLSACQNIGLFEPTATPVPPTPTPLPPTELTICQGTEPDSLYPYALSSQSARDLSQLIYNGPFSQNGDQTGAVTSENASYTPVSVRAGDQVVNVFGELIVLESGAQVFPSGCTTSACAITWDGTTEIQMDQPVVNFTLANGLTWSDGQAVTAADSVYSYELAADKDTPVSKTYNHQTAGYIALDDSTVQWTGKPGLVSADLANYFWMPLPQHLWGELSAAELLDADTSARSPLGWGPYQLDEWTAGEHMRFSKNPYYFRAGEGLPQYDIVNVRFASANDFGSAVDGTCDIVAPDALAFDQVVANAASLADSDYQLRQSASGQFEFLALGITPASYDDTYYPYGADRPDIFGDVNVRKAMAMCIDRQGILDELSGGLVGVSDSYLSADNGLLNGLALTQYPYDPAQGISILDQIGWKDYDQNPATPLTMIATNTRVPYGTTFAITLYTSQSPLRAAIAQRVADDLVQCGIAVTVEQQALSDLYRPGPDGPIFGRAFDLALMSMDIGREPRCELFASNEIPTAANNWIGTSTGGSNFMGYESATYDAACQASQSAGLDATAYTTEKQNTLLDLANDLPFIPLYHHPDFLLVKKDVCLPEDLNSLAKILSSIETFDPNIICQ